MQASSEAAVFEALLRWMGAAPGGAQRGERLARHVRFATMPVASLQRLLAAPLVARAPRLRVLLEQGVAVARSGTAAAPRPLIAAAAAAAARGAAATAAAGAPGAPPQQGQGAPPSRSPGAHSARGAFAFDSSRCHASYR
jgi:hypothetical protein